MKHGDAEEALRTTFEAAGPMWPADRPIPLPGMKTVPAAPRREGAQADPGMRLVMLSGMTLDGHHHARVA